MDQNYTDFLNLVPDELQGFVDGLNSYLLEKKCKRTIKPAAKGYLVSYSLPQGGKSLLNYVFRSGCVKARVYATHVAEYENVIDKFADSTKKVISSSLDCKKLNGKECSPTCPAGYTFVLDGKECKKCRSMAFLITLSDSNNPIIKEMIEKEVDAN